MTGLVITMAILLLVYAFVRLVVIPYNDDEMTWEERNDY